MAFEQLTAFADLPLRIMLGIVFLYHGYPKMLTAKGFKGHVQTVKSIGFRPAAFWALCSAVAEFFGGLGLLFGAFTRIAAALIAINMFVALYASIFQWGRKFSIIEQGYEYELVLIAAALTLAFLGAGPYSLDVLYGLPFA
jgi:putative oxidoreductase